MYLQAFSLDKHTVCLIPSKANPIMAFLGLKFLLPFSSLLREMGSLPFTCFVVDVSVKNACTP